MPTRSTAFKRLVAAGLTTAAAAGTAYLIIPFEGSVKNPDGTHRVYLDAVGIPTACYGQTGTDHLGRKIQLGMNYTEEECLEMLKRTVQDFEKRVDNLVKVSYASEYQKAALISFAYNVGIGNFQNSTLLKRMNSYDYNAACDELSRWVYAQKQKLNGLVRRRAEERLWCLGQVPIEVRQSVNSVDMTAALIRETTPVSKDIDVENTSDANKEEFAQEAATPAEEKKSCRWNNRLLVFLFCR